MYKLKRTQQADNQLSNIIYYVADSSGSVDTAMKLTETIELELEKYRQKAAARLSTIMDQASDEAEANGLTPDILASILEQIES